MGFGSFIKKGIGGIAGGVLGLGATVLGNHSARQEAQANRDFQENMSNTAVQRRVADMKAVGFNPLLAVENAGSGASTPSGSQADIKHFNPESILALSNAKLINAQAKAQEQENSIFDTKAEKLRLQNDLERQNILTAQVKRELIGAQTLGEKASILKKQAETQGIYMSIEKAKRDVQLLDVRLDSIEGSPVGLDMKMMSEMSSNPLKVLGTVIGGISSTVSHIITDITKPSPKKNVQKSGFSGKSIKKWFSFDDINKRYNRR